MHNFRAQWTITLSTQWHLCGTILLTLYSMVRDWRVFIGLNCSHPFCLLLFSFVFCLSMGWYCGAGVFGPIGCPALSPGFALTTIFNNNSNNNHPSEFEGKVLEVEITNAATCMAVRRLTATDLFLSLF